jgi:hypothetical protein
MSTGSSREPASSVIVIDDDDNEKEAVHELAKSLPITGSQANVAPERRAGAAEVVEMEILLITPRLHTSPLADIKPAKNEKRKGVRFHFHRFFNFEKETHNPH